MNSKIIKSRACMCDQTLDIHSHIGRCIKDGFYRLNQYKDGSLSGFHIEFFAGCGRHCIHLTTPIVTHVHEVYTH